MNLLSAIGNLGKDAEIRFTHSGKAVTSFSLALTSGWGDNKTTTWVNCSLWGKGGDPAPVSPFLTKGAKVGVQGPITLRTYKKEDGTQGYSLDLNVRDVTLCGTSEASTAPDPTPQPSQDHAQPATDFGGGDFDSDIPFAPYMKGTVA